MGCAGKPGPPVDAGGLLIRQAQMYERGNRESNPFPICAQYSRTHIRLTLHHLGFQCFLRQRTVSVSDEPPRRREQEGAQITRIEPPLAG
jgi:hypothetical protein